jgi:hypothetical protein
MLLRKDRGGSGTALGPTSVTNFATEVVWRRQGAGQEWTFVRKPASLLGLALMQPMVLCPASKKGPAWRARAVYGGRARRAPFSGDWLIALSSLK